MNNLTKKNKIYYWANSISNNDGEGILANNYLTLLKKNYKNHSFINLNKYKYKSKESFTFKYILPFYGVFLLWKYKLQNKKISYINYLPLWNILLILALPNQTIMGPVTGTTSRKNFNFLVKILYIFGIRILLYKYKKIIFSHDFFKNLVPKNKIKNCYFNFLLFNFKFVKYVGKKKFDFIFYLRQHNNKGNDFIFNLIKVLSEKKYKICVIGKKIKYSKNIFAAGKVDKNKALKLIASSKYAVGSIENLYSYFILDSLSYNLKVFVNKKFKIDKSMFGPNKIFPIDFYDLKKSINDIEKIIKYKKSHIKKFKQLNFDKYFIF